MAHPRFRGAVWLDELIHIREAYGSDIVDRALQRLSPAQREELDRLLPISWVTVDLVMAVKNAVAEEIGMDPLEFQKRAVRAGVARTVKGFWRLIVRQLWDDALAKRLPMLYSRTFERGELRVEEIGDCRARLRLIGWPDMPDYDRLGLATGIEAICDLAGRQDTRVQFHSDKGNLETLFDVTWRRR